MKKSLIATSALVAVSATSAFALDVTTLSTVTRKTRLLTLHKTLSYLKKKLKLNLLLKVPQMV